MALWLIRAGKEGKNEKSVLHNNIISIGWNELQDLSSIDSVRNLSRLYLKTYPQKNKGAVATNVAQIWSFIKRIKKGDLVALPLKSQPQIAIGEVEGDYEYKDHDNIKHTRQVKWLGNVLRSDLDEDILKSLGTYMTVGRIRKNTAEGYIKRMLQSTAATTSNSSALANNKGNTKSD